MDIQLERAGERKQIERRQALQVAVTRILAESDTRYEAIPLLLETIGQAAAGLLRVTHGWVAFAYNGREAFIPQGAVGATRVATDLPESNVGSLVCQPSSPRPSRHAWSASRSAVE